MIAQREWVNFYALFIILLNVKGPKLIAYTFKCSPGLERKATNDGTKYRLDPEGCKHAMGIFPGGT